MLKNLKKRTLILFYSSKLKLNFRLQKFELKDKDYLL